MPVAEPSLLVDGTPLACMAVNAARKPKRTEQAVDVALALTFLVTASGAVLIVLSLLMNTRATLPALGLILFLVGLLLGFEFGVRPAMRQERSPLTALMSGLRRLGGWAKRMVGG